jgi:hypothetical protein
MANTYTPTYNLIQPEVGADTNAWGTHINTDLSTVDTHMLSRALTTSQTAAGPMVFGQTFRVNGAVTFDSTLLVTGNTTLSGTLSTSGAATFSSTMAITGATTITGAATLNSTLAVAGAATFSSTGAFTGVVSVATPTLSGHATTKSYVDTADALKLNLTGGTLTGNLSIVNSTTEMTLTLGSSAGYYFGNATTAGWKNSSGTARVSWNISSGDFTAAGNVTAYSDAKLKKDVEPIDGALGLVNLLRGVRYTRIDTEEKGIGVIAQELQKVFPELVHENDGTLSVAYANLTGVLIEAVKELTQRVRKLESL